jgi:hypothetical protein
MHKPPKTRRDTVKFARTPKRVQELYDEIIVAYNSGLFVLAVAGTRILYDVVRKAINVKGPYDLKAKIEPTHKVFTLGNGRITRDEVEEMLDDIYTTGNKAIHYGRIPKTEEEIEEVMRNAQNLLWLFYGQQ